eukprot:2005874-Rhodomonas_salina.2
MSACHASRIMVSVCGRVIMTTLSSFSHSCLSMLTGSLPPRHTVDRKEETLQKQQIATVYLCPFSTEEYCERWYFTENRQKFGQLLLYN